MKIQVLQHVPFEGPGSMLAWFADRDAELRYTHFYDAPALPDPAGVDMVVAMGGPMSVNDERRYPWLAGEKAFLRQAIERGLPVLGVCLGAQLIASALGARVYAGECKEIGWFPVQGVDPGDGGFAFAGRHTVFHWHGETFDLPPGSVRIAASAACPNQGFRLGSSVIGLQFHLETTPDAARDLVANCRDELVAAPYVQSEAQILAASAQSYRAVNALMDRVLDALASP